MNIALNVATVVALAIAPAAHGSWIIDQNQPNASVIIASIGGPPGSGASGQTFKQASGAIAGAGLFLENGYSTTLTIALYNAPPSAGGTKLTQGSAYKDGNSPGWADVEFASIILVDPTATPYLTYWVDPYFGGSPNHPRLYGSASNPYPNGEKWLNGVPQPNDDLAFRTYTVPSPATILFGALGSALTFVRRRR